MGKVNFFFTERKGFGRQSQTKTEEGDHGIFPQTRHKKKIVVSTMAGKKKG